MSNRFMDLLRPHLQRLQGNTSTEDDQSMPDQQKRIVNAIEAEGIELVDPDLRYEWQEVPMNAWLSPGETPDIEIEHFDDEHEMGDD